MAYGTTTNNEFIESGYIWIPYVLLLIYLYSEHIARGRNVQSNIILLITIGAVLRCIWFILAPQYAAQIGMVFINRLAILMQFSSISILILMWSRAIKISQWTDREYHRMLSKDNNSDIHSKVIESTHCNDDDAVINNHHLDEQFSKNDNSIFSMAATMNMSTTSVISRTIAEVLAAFKAAHQRATSKLTSEKVFKGYVSVTVIVNIAVWILLLFTFFIGSSQYWYDFNIVAISLASLVAALVTFIEGLRISISLQKTLSPVYVNNDGSSAHIDQERGLCNDSLCCCCFGSQYSHRIETCINSCIGCCGVYSLLRFVFHSQSQQQLLISNQGLYMQKEVLKMILSVTFIISFFFMVRSFGFMYRPIVIEDAGAGAHRTIIGQVLYPFFFYQFPELIPSIYIAWGISPPEGILRWATYRVSLLCTYIQFLSQGEVLSKKTLQLRQQQSAFRANRGESNATVRLESSSLSQQWFGRSSIFYSSSRRSTMTPSAPHTSSLPRMTESLKMVMNPLSRPSSINRPDHSRPSSINRPDRVSRASSSSVEGIPAINVPPLELEGVSNDNEDRRFQFLETDSNKQSETRESIHIPEVLRPGSRTISDPLEQDSWTMERLISIELTEMMYQIHSFSTVDNRSSRGSSGRHLSEAAEASMSRRIVRQPPPSSSSSPPSSSSSSMKTSFFSWWR